MRHLNPWFALLLTGSWRKRALAVFWTLLACALLLFGSARWTHAQQGGGTDFDHASTGFVLNGQHQNVRCETCHTQGTFKGTPKDCASCHGWNNPRAQFSFMPRNHIPTGNASCESCHSATQAQFADAALNFSHVNVVSLTCANCHSSKNPHPGVMTNPSDATHQAVLAQNQSCDQCHNTAQFTGSKMPANHIPTGGRACNQCHTGSDFKAPLPSTAQIHAGVVGNCASCHETNATWFGMELYPMVGNTGFQTRPQAVAGPFNVADAFHPATGECSQCHVGISFDPNTSRLPANHIPVAAGSSCLACHTSGDFSIMPTLTAIHANAPSTSSNCQQCHSASAASAYAMPTMVPPLVAPPSNHIGTSGQSCEVCHVGPSSSITATPVRDGARFANSAFNHSGNTGSCASCHGPGVGVGTFFGVTPKSVSSLTPAHIPYSSSCDSCHINSVPAGQIGLSLATAGMTSFANASFSHIGITTGCGTCHGDTVTASSFFGVVPRNTAQLSPAHIPATASCETCHVSSIPSAPVSVTGANSNARFSGAGFSHSGISSGCANCHGAGLGGGSFFGVSSLVVMPSTAPGAHIPSTTTCESCHAASMPAALVSVTAPHTVPGSAFRNAAPAANQIHSGTSASCSACHEAGMTWMGMDLALYARVPASYTGVPTDLYRGFQTRPVLGGSITSVDDAAHPTVIECSNCHGNTTAFSAPTAPSNHIPYAVGVACSTCHGDFSAAPRISVIHANIQSTSSNCVQCHSTANAALYASATSLHPIKTPGVNHIPMGSLSCEGCHVGANSSLATTPVPDGASFAGSLFNHSGANVSCATCHGAAVTATSFTGVYPAGMGVLSPTHLPTTAACDSCHVAGAPVGLVPAAGMTTFANAQFSHAGISSGCANCHGPNVSSTAGFFGVNPIIVMPPSTGANAHIPSSTTCESCHVGIAPAGLIAASSANSVGNSLFRNAPPSSAQIHANTAGACSSCHEAGSAWVGMDLPLYVRNPASFTTATALYKGFQTRPLPTASGYSIGDSGHPLQGSGECSLCHGDTVAFTAPSAPANHIPYVSSAVCGDCHAPFGTQPTNAAIHAKLQSPTSNCEQCHSTANAALYASTTTVKPIKTPSVNHIPMGNLGCASCHVGANSSISALPVGNSSSFANSAFSHAGISTGCNECHGVNVDVGTFDGVTPKSVSGQTPAHIPVANTLGCETCHVASIPPGLVPPSGYAGSPSFAGGQFIHTGITSGCEACHGSAINAGSFKGVSSIVVIPPSTGANAHIPSVTTCETCHLGSVPSGLLSVTATHAVPGSAFQNAPPDTNKIHAGVSSGCTACHEAGLSWVGMSAYPRTPATLSANPAQLYTGFHTRPGNAAAGFSLLDASHPATGDCTQCHGDVQAFGAPTKPANHIPYASGALCSACHNPFGTHPTIAAIHANLQSPGSNCAQCHSTANAATYSSASRTIVAPGATHVPMRGLGCESCHVGTGSSIPGTPVTGSPTFAGSAFSHSGMTTNCAECHGQAINAGSFQGISSIVVMPPSSTANSSNHIPSGTTCENCHSGSMPSTLVPGNAPHAAPNSGFLTSPPNSAMTHGGVTGSCASCHEKDMVWMSVGAYTSTKSAPYTGFQTRPYAGAGTYFVTDALHPASGDCSNCHSGFTEWASSVKPANHIPTANVACANCHTTSNFSTLPTLALIHANAPSTSSNCAQCHSAANAALYNTSAMTIVAPANNHIPMGSLGCESCHVGTGSSITNTPVPNAAVFSNSAFSHTGVTASCATCHAGISGSTFQGGIVPVTLTSPALSPVHVPNPAGLDCGICHLAIPAGLSRIGSTSTTFASGQFSHSGITTGCSTCHGSGIGGTSFKGINPIVVLPPTSAGNHIPSPVNSSCETCHLGSTPSTLLAASSANATPGSTKFKSPTPSGSVIHTSISTGCNSCHETGSSWLDISLYPHLPTVLTAGATYTGFHTRPGTASATSVADASHPATGVGDCSDCHGSTVNFSAVAKPANHIPTSASAQCQNCHTNLVGADGVYVSSSVNFAVLPTVSNIHTYAPSTTANCAQCHSAANAASYAIASAGFAIKSPASVANHIPFGSTACEVCHVYSGGTLTTPVTTGASFAGGRFSHAGFTTGCASCHGAGITNTTFTGVTAIVAIAASSNTPGATTHIPYTASCETCHSATVPSGLVPVTSVGTRFASPLAAGTVIHSNSTSIACKTCHERAANWLGMANYPRTPAALNLAVPTTAYNGFQTRPGAAATTYGYTDAGHTGSTLDTGDCALCHAGTTAFTGEGKPAGHLPTTVTSCATCHAVAGDFSVAGLAAVGALHTGVTSGTLVAATTANMLSKTCGTCHTVGTGGTSGTAPFAGCDTQAACTSPPPITYQPATTGLHPVHVPTGTSTALTVDCNGCHTSVSSFAGTNMKNATMHSSVNGVAKVLCMSCHERGLAFYGVTNLKVRPSGHHTGQDCAGSGCHTYSGGFRALVKPVMRSAQVAPDMGRIRPTPQTNKPSRGSLGNNFDHKGVAAGQCKTCHDGKSASGMPARHLMVATSCDTCHRPTTWLPAQFSHNGITPNTCLVCHNGMNASGKPAGHFMSARSCDSCHKTVGWMPVNYQHLSPLYVPSPDKLSCISCHDTNGEIIRRQARALTRTKPIPLGQ